MKSPMRVLCLALLATAACGKVYFQDTFANLDGWVQSDQKADEGQAGKIELATGPFNSGDEDNGLKAVEDAKFYFVSKTFEKFSMEEGKPLVFQYQVRFPQDIDCGGGYLKLLPSGVDQASFNGDSAYALMFGPDICGYSTKRVHAIFGATEDSPNSENLLINDSPRCEDDQFSHTYTFIVDSTAGTYQILIDGEEKKAGNIKEDWSFEVAKQIKDPEASKPEDWVDDRVIDDPESVKPEDWDQPEQIADPEAEKPDDWDDEDDGEWEPPLIRNPDFKGEWKPETIENPEYKGEWEHPLIDNPDYKEVTNAGFYTDIGAVAIEVWQVKAGTIWDNIIVTDDPAEAEAFRKDTAAAEKAEKERQDEEAEAARKAEEEAAAAAAAEAEGDTEEVGDEGKDEDEDDDLAELDGDEPEGGGEASEDNGEESEDNLRDEL